MSDSPRKLRVLLVEDSEDDANLLTSELRKGGLDVEPVRVEELAVVERELRRLAWDAIIADYHLNGFTAFDVLALYQSAQLDCPFLVVSGAVGEDVAARLMRAGAHDFLLKDRLARLVSALQREMREAAIRVERRRAVEHLELAVRARDEFLSIASHELKTPLTTLELQLGSIASVNDERVAGKLQVVHRQVRRLTDLVNTLLDVNRITSRPLEIVRVPCDLCDVATEAIRRLSTEAQHAECEVKLVSTGPVVGDWDAERVRTVVENLLSNAIKYGRGKPVEISLSLSENGDRMGVVRVKDSGIGISDEDRERIFGRFERAVPERHYGGLGIGLWLAHQIVTAHGGRIGVESRCGIGSTFTVELPC